MSLTPERKAQLEAEIIAKIRAPVKQASSPSPCKKVRPNPPRLVVLDGEAIGDAVVTVSRIDPNIRNAYAEIVYVRRQNAEINIATVRDERLATHAAQQDSARQHRDSLLGLKPAFVPIQPDTRNDGHNSNQTTCHRYDKRTKNKISHLTTSLFCPR